MERSPEGTSLDLVGLAVLGDALADAVVVIDGDACIRWANRAAERVIGESLAAWLGRPGFELIHPDDLTMAARSLETVQTKEAGTPIELRVRCSAGWRLMEVLGSRLDEHHTVIVLRDLTQRRRWEVAGDDTARFRSLVHNAADLTVLLDGDGTVVSASAAITRVLGHDPEVVCERPFTEIVGVDDRSVFTLALRQAIGAASGEIAVAEVSLRTHGGAEIPFELSIVSLLDDPTVEGLVVSGHDITRLRIAQDALSELANYDSLTGLLNRRSFDEALEREWRLTQRDGIDSYVAVLDLDGFKQLNDTHGHAAGDEALRQVSRALKTIGRSTDIFARLGGDEFGALLVRCGGEPAAIGLVARLEEELALRTWPAGATVSATAGYHSLRRSDSPDDALHRADLAMLARKGRRLA